MKHFRAFVILFVLSLGLVSSAALADLCSRCADKTYTADLGKCVLCGAHTSSGAFKLCKKCSSKRNECECCRATLAVDEAGAETKEEEKPHLHLTMAESGKDLFVEPETRIEVLLFENPSTGFTWQVARPAPRKEEEKETSPEEEPPVILNPVASEMVLDKTKPMALGAGGQRLLTFDVGAAGKKQIALEYLRRWEKGRKPARKFTITITVEEVTDPSD